MELTLALLEGLFGLIGDVIAGLLAGTLFGGDGVRVRRARRKARAKAPEAPPGAP